MPRFHQLSTIEILDFCELLATQDNLHVTVVQSFKDGVIAGFGGVMGGLLFGPIGIAIGGAVGGLVGAATAKRYKPLWHAIREMSNQDQTALVAHMQAVISDLGIRNHAMLMATARHFSAREKRQCILNALKNFCADCLGTSVKSLA